MSKKDEFSDLARELDRKFKEIEAKKQKKSESIKQIEKRAREKNQDTKKDKIKEQKEHQKFRVKEKLTTVFIIFIICQLLLIPICFSYSDQFLAIWMVGTFSICIICIAFIDLGP